MTKQASSISAIFAALPAVQDAVRTDIAERILAGEIIGRVEGDRIISTVPTAGDLAERRRQIMERHASELGVVIGSVYKFQA